MSAGGRCGSGAEEKVARAGGGGAHAPAGGEDVAASLARAAVGVKAAAGRGGDARARRWEVVRLGESYPPVGLRVGERAGNLVSAV